ncbi:glycerol uptake facilitator-like aquaporin [Bradyrhizobium sp. LB7.2]
MPSMGRRIASEWLGTALLLAAVVGSGSMAQRLSGGNVALALLCNTISTGPILVVLVFGPLSGAHLNPAVSLALALRGELTWPAMGAYILAQLAGSLAGVFAAHLMFDIPLWQVSITQRIGAGQWIAEAAATSVARHDLRLREPNSRCGSLCRWIVYNFRLLVHGIHFFRQSRSDYRTIAVRHLHRHRAE